MLDAEVQYNFFKSMEDSVFELNKNLEVYKKRSNLYLLQLDSPYMIDRINESLEYIITEIYIIEITGMLSYEVLVRKNINKILKHFLDLFRKDEIELFEKISKYGNYNLESKLYLDLFLKLKEYFVIAKERCITEHKILNKK